MKLLGGYIYCLLFFLFCGINVSEAQWHNLIGDGLNNWEQKSGAAEFTLKDGVIIGTTKVGPPFEDAFLCTKSNYDDFILEFDCKDNKSLNSGVNIRSWLNTDGSEGSVSGLQVEIDPSSRAWTGGIYEQSGRSWLYTLDINPPAKKAFKNDQWNHFRIEAIGSSIRVWVNGIPTADLIDDNRLSGFIALQVHSIRNDISQEGQEVKFKNVRIISKDAKKYATSYKPVIPQVSFLTNKLSAREKSEGWELLWDGKTTKGWRGAKLNEFPQKGWQIKDGELSVLPIGHGGESEGGGDIVTFEEYKSFILVVDFKYSNDANSGIKYLVNTELNKEEGSAIGCEFQILDDRHNADAAEGVAGDRKLGSLYDLISPRKTRDNGIDKWNRAKIVVNGNHVEHWLNGQMTLEYERNSDMWRSLVSKSKYHIWPDFGNWEKGNILLQDHGHSVSFKNIKIKTFDDHR